MATDSTKVLELVHDHSLAGIPDGANGVGEAEDPTCGDVLTIGIRVNARQVVEEAGFTITAGACLPSTAAGAAAVRLAQGKPALAAYTVNAQRIGALLSDEEGPNEEHLHCCLMAELALKRAVAAYSKSLSR